MKIIYFGTPDFAVPILERLVAEHEVLAVVSQPDKPKNRGKKVIPTPVKAAAFKHSLPVIQPKTVREKGFFEKISSYKPDVIILAAYGQLIPEELLKLPKYGFINVHASLLPKYRGAAPIQRAIIDGETETGVTIMYMVKELDAGDMLLKKTVAIDPDDNYGTLHDKLAALGADAISEALALMEKGKLTALPQDNSLSTYAKKITKEMGELDFSKPAPQLVNLIRGLNPYPAAYTFCNGEKLKVYAARAVKTESDFSFGTVISADKEGILVAVSGGGLLITEIQAAGSRRMSASAYLLGHKIDKNQTFGR